MSGCKNCRGNEGLREKDESSCRSLCAVKPVLSKLQVPDAFAVVYVLAKLSKGCPKHIRELNGASRGIFPRDEGGMHITELRDGGKWAFQKPLHCVRGVLDEHLHMFEHAGVCARQPQGALLISGSISGQDLLDRLSNGQEKT